MDNKILAFIALLVAIYTAFSLATTALFFIFLDVRGVARFFEFTDFLDFNLVANIFALGFLTICYSAIFFRVIMRDKPKDKAGAIITNVIVGCFVIALYAYTFPKATADEINKKIFNNTGSEKVYFTEKEENWKCSYHIASIGKGVIVYDGKVVELYPWNQIHKVTNESCEIERFNSKEGDGSSS